MSQVKGLNLIQKLSGLQRIQFLHTQPKKRFYKNVSVVQANGQFEINLDHRKLKTPMGSPLLVDYYPFISIFEVNNLNYLRFPVKLWPMQWPMNGCLKRKK